MNRLMMGTATQCMICHKKNRHRYKDALRIVDTFLDRHGIPRHTRLTGEDERTRATIYRALTVFSNEQCEYGLPCNNLEMANSEFRRDAEETAARIVAYINNDGNRRELMEVLRGDLGNACHVVERL